MEWEVVQDDGFTTVRVAQFAGGWLVMTVLWNRDKTAVESVQTMHVPEEVCFGYDPDDPEPDESSVVKFNKLAAVAGQA